MSTYATAYTPRPAAFHSSVNAVRTVPVTAAHLCAPTGSAVPMAEQGTSGTNGTNGFAVARIRDAKQAAPPRGQRH